jgi:carboxyl-terminal processing protease
MKKALEVAKKEKMDAAIAAEYQQLLNALERSQMSEVDKNKNEISNLLVDELIKRYRYKEGLYRYYTEKNPEIKKAVGILQNEAEYQKILKP